MNRKRFISEVNKRLKKNGVRTDIDNSKIIVVTIFETLFHFISLGHEIRIMNFGVFRSNLETKTLENKIYKRYVIKFNASKSLKKEINKHQVDED